MPKDKTRNLGEFHKEQRACNGMKKTNLVSLASRDPAERAEIARRGGLAWGAKRRKNKDMIQALQTLMQAKVKDENGDLVFVSEAIAANIVFAALEGDYRFTRLLTDHLYGTPYKRTEKPEEESIADPGQKHFTVSFVDNVRLTVNDGLIQDQLARMGTEELEKISDLVDAERKKRGMSAMWNFSGLSYEEMTDIARLAFTGQ